MKAKKKVLVIGGSIVGGILCLLAAGAIILAVKGLTVRVGMYAGDGVVLFDGSPVVTVDHTRDGKLFSGLQPGDTILVLRNNAELCSYPGATGMYKCVKLKSGDQSDVPEGILDTFRGEISG